MAVYGYVCADQLEFESHVYFIRDGRGNIKIGVANDIGKRLKALQTANADKLEMFFAINVDDKYEAYRIERALHNKFKNDHKHGEWFLEKNIIEWLRNGDTSIAGWRFENIDW